MKKRILRAIVILTLLPLCLKIQAQTNTFPSTGAAGIGTTSPNASSLLEVKSTTKGVLIPRMTQTQRNAIASPATGLLIYQTDKTPGFYYYSGSAWTAVSPKAKGWSIIGNAGTDSSINFVGTTDAHPLVVRVNNQKAGWIDYSATRANTGFGYHTLNLNTTGNSNAAFGYNALSANTTGSSNTANGGLALYVNTTGSNNTANGYASLYHNTTGYFNTANGDGALYSNTTGHHNTASGLDALYSDTSGIYNTADGVFALYSNTNGNYNTAAGYGALNSNTTASYNTAHGYGALYTNTTGSGNTANGYESLYYSSTGSNNTAVGVNALLSNVNGSYNTANGYDALAYNNGGNYNTANGYEALHNAYSYNNTATGSYALYSNTTGYSNVAVGISSLAHNQTGSNLVAVGDSALLNNTASYNIAAGSFAAYTNTTGDFNTAIGTTSLYHNRTGNNNTATGYLSLSNTTGSGNTANGVGALQSNTTGNFNTALGDVADINSLAYTNATMLGYGTNGTANNQVRIGNSSVTSIGGYANWTNISDGRVKKNIKENVPGLAFINKLKPLTYNLDLDAADKIIQRPVIKDQDARPDDPRLNDSVGQVVGRGNIMNQPTQGDLDARRAKEQIVYTGFIAQDVEKAAKSLNYDFSGVDAAKNNKDLYGLRYAEFVVPLVKAVQELSQKNDTLQQEVDELKQLVTQLSFSSQPSSLIITSAYLKQNTPNPFSKNTIIQCYVPSSALNAQLIVNSSDGKQTKTFVLMNGINEVRIDASMFSSGDYVYFLLIDGRKIDSKSMIISK